jgi:conjugal transfer ATP-binding protein TraC
MPQDPNNIADLLSDQAKDTLKEEKASEVPPQDFIPKSKEDSVPENHGDVVIKPKNTPQSESKKESGGKRLKKKNVLQLLFHNLFSKQSHQTKKSEKVPEDSSHVDNSTKPELKNIPLTEVSKENTGIKKSMSKSEKQKEVQGLKAAEKKYHEGMATIRDMIAPSSMEIQGRSMKLGDTYCRSFFVYAYPRFIEANWLAPLINLDVTIDISMFVYPSDSMQMLKVLRKKVAQMHSTMRINQDKGKVRDPAIEVALQDAEELRDQLQRGEEKFFHLGLYFTVYAKDEDKLDKISTEIEAILGGKLVLTKRANLQMEHGLISSIPLGIDEIQISRNMNTSPLSTTFPFTSSDLTSDKGILYGLNRHNDSLIIFDRFSLENANSVVFAKSGAGKSYAVKLEMLRLIMTGVDVLVIDPEKEYKDLCETVGGTYMNISLNSPERINPFDLPQGLKDEDTRPGDLLRSAIITLHGLFNLMLGKLTPEEEAIMDKALLDCYGLKGINMETEDPGESEAPTMGELYDILSSTKGAESLATRLQKYTTGSFAGIFNHNTNVDLSGGMLVFNIRDLEEELRPIATYILLNFIWNRVRSSLKKRVLVIDEAWSMMQYEDSAKFLFGLVKRARKYWLGITTITQDTEDFINSKYGRPVITNSSMQLLLKQAPSAISGLASIFNLTQGETYMLLNSGIGQGLFFAGNKHVACQIIASYSEDKVITTDPEEIAKRSDATEGE